MNDEIWSDLNNEKETYISVSAAAPSAESIYITAKQGLVCNLLNNDQKTQDIGESTNRIIKQLSFHPKKKKHISFGCAWKGKLEETRIICVEDNLFEEPSKTAGRFILKCKEFNLKKVSTIELCEDMLKQEKVIDVEISHGCQSVASPPWTLKDGQRVLDLDWECNWLLSFNFRSISESTPLTVKMNVRSLFEPCLKRALTTKFKVKSFSSKMISKLQRHPSLENVKDNYLTQSLSFSGLKSINLLKSTPSPLLENNQKVTSISIGSFTISNLKDLIKKCDGKVHEFSADFVQSIKTPEADTKIIGRIVYQAILFRPTKLCPMVTYCITYIGTNATRF